MARTNVNTKHGLMGLILLFIWGCDATTTSIRPPNQPVAVESRMSEPEGAAVIPMDYDEAKPEAKPEQIVAVSEDKPANENPTNTAETAPTECEPVESGEVVHYAELRGRVETHAGKRLTIEPLVVTSATLPVPGCLANMFIEMKNDDGQLDWRHFAEVRVASRVHFGMPMELELVESINESPNVQDTLEALAKGSRVRIQWVW